MLNIYKPRAFTGFSMNVPSLMFDLCITVHMFTGKYVLNFLHNEAAEPDLKQTVGIT